MASLLKKLTKIFLACTIAFSSLALAGDLTENSIAPTFKASLHDGTSFDLQTRKGKWTVLYFYPKAGTPGCTKQACGFRDSIEKIRALGAEVYGISGDSLKDQAAFHQKHHLNFPLIADPEAKIIESYGVKMPVVKMAKRWTFILDSELKIRKIEKDVDPVLDANKIVSWLSELQKTN